MLRKIIVTLLSLVALILGLSNFYPQQAFQVYSFIVTMLLAFFPTLSFPTLSLQSFKISLLNFINSIFDTSVAASTAAVAQLTKFIHSIAVFLKKILALIVDKLTTVWDILKEFIYFLNKKGTTGQDIINWIAHLTVGEMIAIVFGCYVGYYALSEYFARRVRNFYKKKGEELLEKIRNSEDGGEEVVKQVLSKVSKTPENAEEGKEAVEAIQQTIIIRKKMSAPLFIKRIMPITPSLDAETAVRLELAMKKRALLVEELANVQKEIADIEREAVLESWYDSVERASAKRKKVTATVVKSQPKKK